jgi:hypothetical protein
MKRAMILRMAAMMLAVMFLIPLSSNAQESEDSSPFSAGADLVSSYLWRGIKFGTGPAVQPYVELGLGNFAVGAWGSYCFTTNEAAEADLYLSYGFDFGLSVGLTDYYFPGTDYFDYSTSTGAHAFEVNLGYEIQGFSLSGNIVLNEAGNAASMGGDMYFELGYSFESFSLFAGGGDGWHTTDGDFMVTNIGIATSKEIQITEKFALPLSGAVILNPDTEQFHVVIGVSF